MPAGALAGMVMVAVEPAAISPESNETPATAPLTKVRAAASLVTV